MPQSVLASNPTIAQPGVFVEFGNDPNRDGLAGFDLIRVGAPDATPRGNWQLEAESLRFTLSHEETGSTYMEVAAMRDLTEWGWIPGEDFTLHAEVEVSGIQAAWNRFGLIALAADPLNHVYGDSVFYHAKYRVRPGSSSPPIDIHIARGFGGDPLDSIPVEATPAFGDGIFAMTLQGVYQQNGELQLRLTVEHSEYPGQWSYEALIDDPLTGTWFGVGGRLRTYSNSHPDISIRKFSLSRDLTLQPGIPIWIDANEPSTVLRAAEDLQRDLYNRFQTVSPISHDPALLATQSCIVILGPENEWGTPARTIEGAEAHRVTVEEIEGHLHLVAQGSDTRGAIYAIYTISEEVLGVPPLWIWSSWQASDDSPITVMGATDIHYPTPYVRWRAWFPNDMDYYEPWLAQPSSATAPINNKDALLETLLRMKMNAIDVGSIMNGDYDGLTTNALRAANRGLVVLSTHTAALGTRLEETRWNNYWNNIRGLPAPDISVDEEEALFDYWQHAVDVIHASGIETIWTVTFRGHGDVPFWENMQDAPETDAERAAVIDHIVRRQVDLLTDSIPTGRRMRATLYNEMSDFFIDGLLTLPERSDLIWNFTAARRDHYPPEGLDALNMPAEQPLGYYFNYQFTSTGSHVAQGEGPWKMEANYRLADSLNALPLQFAIVNAGNIREFVMELAANATMMWDYTSYTSDRFLRHFAGDYFGRELALPVAALYEDFYAAYWQQRAPTLSGFDRQYIFHDLRYGRAMRDILSQLENGTTTNQPLPDLTFYNIDPSHSSSGSIREALEKGTMNAIPKWESLINTAELLFPEIKPDGQQFFADNMLMQARFMLAINQTLNALSKAVSPTLSSVERKYEIGNAYHSFQSAWTALREAEHSYFANWYPAPGQRDIFHLNNTHSRLNHLLWSKVDDFESGQEDQLLSQHPGWSTSGDNEAFWITVDPNDPANKVLKMTGETLATNSHAWTALPHLLESGGTLFYRQLIQARVVPPDNRQTFRVGLNSAEKGAGDSWFDYNVRKEIDYNAHRASDGRTLSTPLLPYAWYNFWFVIDTTEETLKVYRTQGNNHPSESDLVTAGAFRESTTALSFLKFARSSPGRDWEHYLDDIYIAPQEALTLPSPVSAAYEQIEIPAIIDEHGAWSHEDQTISFRVRGKSSLAFAQAQPTVLYLENLPIPRLGTHSDSEIIEDLLAEDLIVITVDCAPLANEKDSIQPALLSLFQVLQTAIPAATKGALVPDPMATYWLPEGYRLARNIPFWNIAQHGAHGSLERIMDTYNSQIVSNFGVDPIDSPSQLLGANGLALDYNLYLDLMYPSGNAATKVPTIAHFATLSQRPSSFRNGERPMEPIGWLLDGYALAYVDHIYNPLARHENYGHFEPGYTLQNWNAIAAGSAAIRFLRAHAGLFNLNSRIGALGHSKSSYSVVRLTDPRHPQQSEQSSFAGFPAGSPEPQPWPGHSSEIAVGFASMGDGTRRTQYFTQGMNPIVIAVGRFDHFNHWDAFPPLVAVCESEDINHLALWMEDMGHDRPFGMDLATGRERNRLIRHFFAQHLQPHDQQASEVLFILPRRHRGLVATTGVTRILTAAEDLPSDMMGLSPERPITVRFARSIDLATITPENLSVWRASTGEQVGGVWTASLQNSQFTFVPDQALRADSVYTIHVGQAITSTSGHPLERSVNQSFQTAPSATPAAEFFVAAPLDLDSNADGIPDWWRLEYFHSTTLPHANELAPNGSGRSIRDHYLSGTNPMDANSAFRLSIQTLTQNPTLLHLHWNSAPGRNYRIETSTTLQQWTHFSDAAATPPINTYSFPIPPHTAPVFFRVVVDEIEP